MDDKEGGQTMSRARGKVEVGVVLGGERLVLMCLAYAQDLSGMNHTSIPSYLDI